MPTVPQTTRHTLRLQRVTTHQTDSLVLICNDMVLLQFVLPSTTGTIWIWEESTFARRCPRFFAEAPKKKPTWPVTRPFPELVLKLVEGR